MKAKGKVERGRVKSKGEGKHERGEEDNFFFVPTDKKFGDRDLQRKELKVGRNGGMRRVREEGGGGG